MVKLTLWPLWIISTEQPPSDILFIPDFTNTGQHYCYAFLYWSNEIFLIQSQMAQWLCTVTWSSLCIKTVGNLHTSSVLDHAIQCANAVQCKCTHTRLYHIHDILQISKQTILIPLLYHISKNLTALLSGHFFHSCSEMWINCCNIFSGTKILTRQETEVIQDVQTVYISGKELAIHSYVCSVNTKNICTLIKNF